MRTNPATHWLGIGERYALAKVASGNELRDSPDMKGLDQPIRRPLLQLALK